MAANRYQLTLNDYLTIVRRRAGLIVATFAVVLAVALAVAVALPPVYRSTGTILVESQQIPPDLVPTTITSFADERIQLIRQRVMTRDNLLRIIERYGLFSEERASLTVSEMVSEMRRNIGIELISADFGNRRRGAATIAFKVSFEHRSADVAHRVANELVTLFLSENAKVRTERASETTQFLTREAEKLKSELEALENQVALYKQQYGNALPEHLDLRMSMLQRAEAELRSVEREYRANQEERRFLELELQTAKAGVRGVDRGGAGPQVDDLQTVRAQYQVLVGRYTESHPDVRALRGKLEVLEAAAATVSDAGDAPARLTAVDLHLAQVQAKIDAADARLASLLQQQQSRQARIAELEAQIIQTPQVERALITLTRDHENARRKYEEVRAKQVDAQIAERLEEDRKAERFSLLEPPLRPDTPIRPDRAKALMLGVVMAGGFSGGLTFLLELVNQRVRGSAAMTALLRQAPLVVIPYITTREQLRRRRLKLAVLLACAIGASVAAAALVHVLYMPLDILFMKIMARLG